MKRCNTYPKYFVMIIFDQKFPKKDTNFKNYFEYLKLNLENNNATI